MFPDEALLATDDLDDTDESHLCTFRDSVLQARGARPPHGRQRRHRHPGRRRPDLALRAYVSGTIRCPLGVSRFAPAEAARLARELADLSPKVEEIGLADAAGRCTLSEVEEAVRATQECVSLSIGLHLHNTFGYALGIAAASVGWGVLTLEESVGGLGGCPHAGPQSMGNLATEDLVYMLDAMGVDTGGVSWKGLLDSGAWLRD